MVKNLKIKKVSVEGIAGIKELKEFTFAELKTIIEGSNGQGKSSLVNAILWCITGENTRSSAKKESILNNSCKKGSVQVEFLADGEDLTVERVIPSRGKPYVSINGRKSSQAKLEEIVFTEIVAFSNLQYFLAMAPNKQKDIFSRLIGEVDVNEILSYIGADNYPEALTWVKDLSKSSREATSQAKKAKEAVNKLSIQIEEAEKLCVEVKETKKDSTEIESLIKKAESELLEISGSKVQGLVSLDELLKQKAAYEKQIMVIENNDDQKQFDLIKQEVILLESKIEATKQKQYVSNPEIEKLKEERTVKLAEYTSLKEKVAELTTQGISLKESQTLCKAGDTCPCCTHIMTSEEATHVNKTTASKVMEQLSALKQEIKQKNEKITELTTQGKQLAERIKKLELENQEAMTKFIQDQTQEVTKLEAELSEKKTLGNEVFLRMKGGKVARMEQIARLQDKVAALKIEDIQAKNNAIEVEFETDKKKQVSDKQVEIEKLRETLQEIQRNNSLIDGKVAAYKRQCSTVNELKKELEIAKEMQKEIVRKHYFLQKFIAKKQDLVNQHLKSLLTNVTLELEKLNKETGEIEEFFKCWYQGPHMEEAVEINKLSRSEKMRVGLEIFEGISKATDTNYFVFVDNAESIGDYTTLEGTQIVELRFVPGSPLQVVSNATTNNSKEVGRVIEMSAEKENSVEQMMLA